MRLSVDGLNTFTLVNNDDIPKGKLQLNDDDRYGQIYCYFWFLQNRAGAPVSVQIFCWISRCFFFSCPLCRHWKPWLVYVTGAAGRANRVSSKKKIIWKVARCGVQDLIDHTEIRQRFKLLCLAKDCDWLPCYFLFVSILYFFYNMLDSAFSLI